MSPEGDLFGATLRCWGRLVLCTILPRWFVAAFLLGWGVARDDAVVQHPFDHQGPLCARRREVGLIEVKAQDLCGQAPLDMHASDWSQVLDP